MVKRHEHEVDADDSPCVPMATRLRVISFNATLTPAGNGMSQAWDGSI
jgi:hypothetical protein